MASATGRTAASAAGTAGGPVDSLVRADHGEIVSIITWILLITSTLAIIARISTKWAVSRKLQIDDGLAVMALLCHIGSGIGVSFEDVNGLGQNLENISEQEREVYGKSSYAADLLYIMTLCFAKLSVIQLFNMITRQKKHRRLGLSLGGFIALETLTFFVGAAFRCRVPWTWDVFSPHCYHRASFWLAFGVINVFTDTALILLPFYIMVPLQMSTGKKVMILSCFGTRIFDIIVIIVQLAYTTSFSSANFTAEVWPWVLLSQLAQCTSIITSCIPYLKPLLESFPSGMFMSDEIRRKAHSTSGSHGYIRTPDNSYIMRNIEKSGHRASVRAGNLRSDREDIPGVHATTVSTASATKGDFLDGHIHPAVPATKMDGILKTTTFSTS